MPTFMHPLMGANAGTLWRAFSRYGGVSPRALPHALAFLGAAATRFPATCTERGMMAGQEDLLDPDSEPLFIIGHWRSGTTHLHNLLGCCPDFGIITPLASGLPWELLTIATWLRPYLERTLPEDRGVDRVAVTAQSPQEDEIPLANMQLLSVFHALYFPKEFQKRFDEGVLFEGVSQEDVDEWKRRTLYFFRKITRHQAGRQPLIKNPVYTARIPVLLEIWPKARFIHIYRDPYVVFQSTVHYFNKLLPELALQRFDHLNVDELVLHNYPRVMQRFDEAAACLDENQLMHVRFEDLERSPVPIIEDILRRFDLPEPQRSLANIRSYLDTLKDYRKNRFTMSDEIRHRVESQWGEYIHRWEYKAPNTR